MVTTRLRSALAASGGRITPEQLVSLVEDADTADLRGEDDLPWMLRVIGRAPNARTGQLLSILSSWMASGAHRRDLARSGHYDQGAAVALMDAWWPRAVQAMFEPVLGSDAFDRALNLLPYDDPPNVDAEAYYDGWYGQVQKDLRDLLVRAADRRSTHTRRGRSGHRQLRPNRGRSAITVKDPYSRVYCGRGSPSACRAALLASLQAAAAAVSAAQGTSDPTRWQVPDTCPVPASGPAPCDEITFTSLGAIGTNPIEWQNRPTFQQVVELAGPIPAPAPTPTAPNPLPLP
jgi:hypothetical protein